MPQVLAGHILRDENGKIVKIQSLKAHCCSVAELCAQTCKILNLENLGYLTGLLHDMGKSANSVQTHLYNNTKEIINHASAGMIWLWDKSGNEKYHQLAAQLAGLVIGCHHGERVDIYAPDGSEPWKKRMDSDQAKDLYKENCEAFFSQCVTLEEVQSRFDKAAEEVKNLYESVFQEEKEAAKTPDEAYANYCMQLGLVQRFLFAALIDADWLDSSSWFKDDVINKAPEIPQWDIITERAEEFFDTLKQTMPIDALRSKISEESKEAGKKAENKVYQMCVPTGGGKTYASARYSLQAANCRGAMRIFYFAPFRSIISQNAEEFKKVLRDDSLLLEHHSDIIPDTTNEALMKQMERWQDVPVIATTMVQFLNTLFAAPRQNVRRMLGLANSILIFDEIQSLPICHTYIFNTAINFLTSRLGCTVVLCTATQPELAGVKYPIRFAEQKDILPKYESEFKQFNRTRLVPVESKKQFTAKMLSNFIMDKAKNNNSILTVLNTRYAVEAVFDEVKKAAPKDITVYCLTTNLCPQHRNDIIEAVRNKLKDKNEKVICVSTQLIEAGVNLSFGCAIRGMASLPSAAQTAGRCNRNGETACRDVYIVDVDERLENLDNLIDIKQGKLATKRILKEISKDADLLAEDSIKRYYEEFYRENSQKDRMGGIRSKDVEPIFDLLTTNLEAIRSWTQVNEGKKFLAGAFLRQAFGTAEKNFRALEDNTIQVLVPYHKEGKDLIQKFEMAEKITGKMLREAERFTVGISETKYDKLEKAGALTKIADGAITVLDESFYDAEKGVCATAHMPFSVGT